MRNKGVIGYKPEKYYEGYTLFCHPFAPNVGRGELAHVYLIDMTGNMVHQWTAKTSVQLSELLPNGNLAYMTGDLSEARLAGLREIDPQSNVVWSLHCRIDHDFQYMENGNIMIHCVNEKMVPNIGSELKRNPYIIEVTKDKELVWEWFGEEHTKELEKLCGIKFPLKASTFKGYSEYYVRTLLFDWAHNNTLEVMPDNPTGKKDSRFEKGNILFSYRSVDIIGIIDEESGEIVWTWGRNVLDGQHQPTMLPNGHILIFDNGTRRGWSRVIELDPLEEEIVWEYSGTPKDSFCSRFISGAQLLPNGNVFICEGAQVWPHHSLRDFLHQKSVGQMEAGQARLFEVTRDKEIVWEYRSPFGVGMSRRIYRATRYSPEFVKPLLERTVK